MFPWYKRNLLNVIHKTILAISIFMCLIALGCSSSNLDKASLDELKAMLNDEDPMIREAAALAAGKKGQEAVSINEDIENAFQDSIPYVRGTALWAHQKLEYEFKTRAWRIWDYKMNVFGSYSALAHGYHGKKRQVGLEMLVEELSTGKPREKLGAIVLLAEMGPEAYSAYPYIRTALSGEDPRVRYWATLSMGDIGIETSEALRDIAASLGDEDSAVRAAGTVAISKIGPQASELTPLLISLFNDPDPVVRRGVAFAVGHIGREAAETIPSLTEAVNSNDIELRRIAARSLGLVGDEKVVDTLVALFDEDDSELRDYAIWGLGMLGQEAADAVPDIIEMLDDENLSVRISAVFALGQIGPDTEAAIPALIEIVRGGNPKIDHAAAESLSLIGQETETIIPVLIEALANEGPGPLGAVAAKALSRLGPEGIDALKHALGDSNQMVQLSSIYGLGEAGPEAKDAVPILLEFLDHKDVLPRMKAVEALGRIGPVAKEALPKLEEIAEEDESWNIREAALDAIALIEETATVNSM